jgi:hypothetical protein
LNLAVQFAGLRFVVLLQAVLEELYQPVNQTALAADHMEPAFMAMLAEDFTQVSLKVSHDDTSSGN